MENQALGLAEAVAIPYEVKRTKLRFPWRFLSPYFQWALPFSFSPQSDRLQAPWPDLLIASGRQSILPALYVKQASHNKTTVVYIQNPVISPTRFDLVVAPRHDKLQGKNVVVTQGALHRVTTSRLAAEKQKFAEFEKLPSPRIAVMLGGTNRSYTFDDQAAHNLANQLQSLQQTYNAGLMISASRRTEKSHIQILKNALDPQKTYIWDNDGPNPYFGMLAWADAILVTCDSISMITEASSTGKPVYLLRLPGGDTKFNAFHTDMTQQGYIRWFEGQLDLTQPNALNETADVAEHVKNLLRSRQSA
jgi:mitochondrial fission protein ELM1